MNLERFEDIIIDNTVLLCANFVAWYDDKGKEAGTDPFLTLTGVDADVSYMARFKTTSTEAVTISARDYQPDTEHGNDWTLAIQEMIEDAKQYSGQVTLDFPKGTYDIYPDQIMARELYITNTVGTDQNNKMKKIGFLFENMENITLDGVIFEAPENSGRTTVTAYVKIGEREKVEIGSAKLTVTESVGAAGNAYLSNAQVEGVELDSPFYGEKTEYSGYAPKGATSAPFSLETETEGASVVVFANNTKIEKNTSSGKWTIPLDGDEKRVFAKGIGAHATCNIISNLSADAGYTDFSVYVGIDANEGTSASGASFSIYDDQTKLAGTEGEMGYRMPMELLSAHIADVSKLRLYADKGASDGSDHVNFADAKLLKKKIHTVRCHSSSLVQGTVTASGVTGAMDGLAAVRPEETSSCSRL